MTPSGPTTATEPIDPAFRKAAAGQCLQIGEVVRP